MLLCYSSPKVVVYFDSVRKQNKKHKSPLTSEFIGGCPANTCVVLMPQIIVPPVPATDIVSSKLIHITYELKVSTFSSPNFNDEKNKGVVS